MTKRTAKQDQIHEMVKNMYKDEKGEPVSLTQGQLEIFETIFRRLGKDRSPDIPQKRNHVSCLTRYGKSYTTAIAVLTRASTFPEKWAIVAGSKDKAQVIMNYVNAHIFDNEYTSQRFRMEKGDSVETIRRHRNKRHISFDVGNGLLGEVYVASAKEALGLGAENVVEDESALIPNNEHTLVMRMLGDRPDDNFLMKIGNPFNRNHFLDSSIDPLYHKIVIDWKQAMDEGRITKEQVEEMRQFSFFDVLYECKFPPAEAVDELGWAHLLTMEDIEVAQERKIEPYGERILGLDVARGGRNYNAWVMRGANYAKVLRKTPDNDLMSVVGTTQELCKANNVNPNNIVVDDVGVGGGVTDRLRELGFNVTAVKEGARAENREEFANMKAELYAGREGVANWVKRIGHLEPHVDWKELSRIRYKKGSTGKTIIEPKDDMRKRGEESPDVADALMLTFAKGVGKVVHTPTPQEIAQGGAGWDL